MKLVSQPSARALAAAWLSIILLAGCGGDGGTTGDAGLDIGGGGDGFAGGGDGDGTANGGGDGGGDGARDWPDGRYITCEEVYRLVVENVPEMLLLNVADEEFYNLGSIAGSLKIPWDELSGRLSEVDARRHIVIYCRRGVRSESAYDTLDGASYPRKWIMEGGIERWNSLGYPTVP